MNNTSVNLLQIKQVHRYQNIASITHLNQSKQSLQVPIPALSVVYEDSKTLGSRFITRMNITIQIFYDNTGSLNSKRERREGRREEGRKEGQPGTMNKFMDRLVLKE